MENLLPEIIINSIFKYLNEIDILNCSIALIGTRNEGFVTQTYLKPQLKIYACLDPNLKKSLKNAGWYSECQDTKLIGNLWKKFEPSLPGKVSFSY